MRITYLDVVFVFPVLFVLVIVYGLGNYQYSVALIPAGILGAVYLVLSRELNLWRRKKEMKEIPSGMKHFLHQHFDFFAIMNQAEKEQFEKKLIPLLFWEFKPSGYTEVDERTKVSTIAYAAFINCFLDDSISNLVDINYVVLYKHQFPSPNHQYLHISEWNEEDQLFIFSEPYILHATIHPKQYFNPALYEYAKILTDKYSGLQFDDLLAQRISGYDLSKICDFMGMPPEELSKPAILVHHALIYPDRFTQLDDKQFQRIAELLQWPESFRKRFASIDK